MDHHQQNTIKISSEEIIAWVAERLGITLGEAVKIKAYPASTHGPDEVTGLGVEWSEYKVEQPQTAREPDGMLRHP